MFNSNYFTPKYFNRYFKKVVTSVTDGGGDSTKHRELIWKDDECVLDVVIAFVLNY